MADFFYLLLSTFVTLSLTLLQAGESSFPGVSQILYKKRSSLAREKSHNHMYFPCQQNTPHMFWFFYGRNISFRTALLMGKAHLNIVRGEEGKKGESLMEHLDFLAVTDLGLLF